MLQQQLLDLTEGNCPLYMIRARTLHALLQNLSNANAQQQYYLTDIINFIVESGGEIRSIATLPDDPEYDLLCADLTRAEDLSQLEHIVSKNQNLLNNC